MVCASRSPPPVVAADHGQVRGDQVDRRPCRRRTPAVSAASSRADVVGVGLAAPRRRSARTSPTPGPRSAGTGTAARPAATPRRPAVAPVTQVLARAWPTAPRRVMPAASAHGRSASRRRAVVVVAGDRPRPRAGVPAQRGQRPGDHLLGVGGRARRCRTGRRRRSTRSGRSASAIVDDLGRARRCARPARDCPLRTFPTCQSEVCRIFIGGLPQNGMSSSARCRRRAAPTTANGSVACTIERSVALGGGPASAGRVAQAGNGNSTHQRHRDLGLGDEHRAGLGDQRPLRCAGGRKPYSGRAASAGSSRPTTRIAELATMRRSTSLAVCCAPIRTTPERAAALGDVEQHLLDRARCPRAARTCSARRARRTAAAWRCRPSPCARTRSCSVTPTTNRCARSGRLCRSTTVTWALSAVLIACGRRGGAGRRGSAGPGRACCRSAGAANALTVPRPTAAPAHVAAGRPRR